MLNHFIECNSTIIAAQTKAFLSHQQDFASLEQTIWQTLTSWYQLNIPFNAPYAEKEQVFWHLIFELHQNTEHSLNSNATLQSELTQCINYLCDNAEQPNYCVGVRP